MGMSIYRTLLAKNMVSAPFVAKAKLGITGNETALRINDQVLRITATANLQPNAKGWQAALKAENHPKTIEH
jgi:defect-in-organelle-trafficking protein DotC